MHLNDRSPKAHNPKRLLVMDTEANSLSHPVPLRHFRLPQAGPKLPPPNAGETRRGADKPRPARRPPR